MQLKQPTMASQYPVAKEPVSPQSYQAAHLPWSLSGSALSPSPPSFSHQRVCQAPLKSFCRQDQPHPWASDSAQQGEAQSPRATCSA